jgi:hypothetical protein
MAERSIVEILMRARGAREVYDSGKLASAGIKDIGDAAVATNRRTELLHKGMLGLGAAGVGMGLLLFEGAKKSVEAYAEYENAAKQVALEVRNSGQAAHVTAGQVEGLAKSLSMISGTDKATVLGGESLLLRFRQISDQAGRGNDIFTRTSKAAMDVSAGMKAAGRNLPPAQAFLMLGKAINDPVKGMTQLRRGGIQLTQAQQDQVKQLVLVGNTLGAQKVILDAVTKAYGGSAKAAGETLTGSLGRLHVATKDIEESLGKGLAPIVTGLTGELMSLARTADPAFTRLGEDLNRVFSDKSTSLSTKLHLTQQDVSRDLGPFAGQMEQGLKDAHLDKKLESAIKWAAPRMLDAMAHAGLGGAKLFLKGFQDADIWGKLLVGGVIAKKLGAFGALGRLIGGKVGGGGVAGELLGRGASPLHPLFVVDVSTAGGKGWLSTAEKDAAKVGGGGALAAASRFVRGGGVEGLGAGIAAGKGLWDALHGAASGHPSRGFSDTLGPYVGGLLDDLVGNNSRDARGIGRVNRSIGGSRLSGYPDGGAAASSFTGGVRAQHFRMVSNITVPVAVDGRVVAEASARVEQHLRARG